MIELDPGDLVDGLIRLMATDAGITGPINIGNPTESTILQLAQMVLRLTSSARKIIFHDLPADDPKQRQPDTELARALLGWQPRVGLEDGLQRTIEYCSGML